MTDAPRNFYIFSIALYISILPYYIYFCYFIYCIIILYAVLFFCMLLFYILYFIYYILPSKDKDNDNNARFGLFWMPGSVREKSVKNMIFTVKYCVLGGLCAFAARYKCV